MSFGVAPNKRVWTLGGFTYAEGYYDESLFYFDPSTNTWTNPWYGGQNGMVVSFLLFVFVFVVRFCCSLFGLFAVVWLVLIVCWCV